jgi:hypothetical protein
MLFANLFLVLAQRFLALTLVRPHFRLAPLPAVQLLISAVRLRPAHGSLRSTHVFNSFVCASLVYCQKGAAAGKWRLQRMVESIAICIRSDTKPACVPKTR